MLLEVNNMRKTFPGAGEVLRNINLKINVGDVLAVIGPSGGGKTTLLRCLNFLETPDEGHMTFGGHDYDLSNIRKSEIAKIRQRTAFVFQSFNLFTNKTALQNVMEGLTVRRIDKKTAREKAENVLAEVGLSDRLNYYPNQLSGGQQQRVAIARAMAFNPEIIYFDEPTSALDPELTHEVMEVINRLASEGRTMIIVTHELSFAKHSATKIAFMDEGTIADEAEPNVFFSSPKNDRIKQFLTRTK